MSCDLNKYQLLIENLPDAFAYHQVVTDNNGKPVDYIFLEVNGAFEEMTGLQRKKIIGKKITEVQPGIEESDFDWIGTYGKVALSGEPVRFEGFSEPLGHWFDVKVYSDKPGFFITVFRDITDSKNSETEAKRRLREMIEIKNIGLLASSSIELKTVLNDILESTINLINASVGMIFIKDQDSGLLTWGASLGLSDEFVNTFKVKPIQMGEGLTGTIVQTGEPIFIQSGSSNDPRIARSVIKKEGLNSFLGVPIFAENKVIGVMNILTRPPEVLDESLVGIVSAIASQVGLAIRNAKLYENQKKLNADLLASEEKFRHIFDHSPIGLYYTNKNGVITDCNEVFVKSMGSTFDAIIGLDTLSLPDQRIVQAIKGALEGQLTTFEGVYDSTTADKKTPLRALYAPVKDSDDSIRGIVAIVEDITERKKAEDEIRTLNEELEERVNERTVQLQAINSELEAFTYSASHDLRGPLNRISGFSEMLLEDYANQVDAQGKDYLQRILNSSQQMKELIDDLLKLSKVSQQQISSELVEVSVLVNVYLKQLQSMEPERSVETVVAPGLVTEADTALIRIALENLLNNAWKYTSGEEKGRIEFGCIVQDGKEAYYIRDNGTGFDMKYSEKLFTAFQRLHDTKTYPGTGVGLSIVSRIIHRHGGDIWAESEPGKGACFYFTLPA